MKKLKILHGSRKVGMSVSSYQNLIDKCRHKFSLSETCALCLSYEDGTEIDEDFFSVMDDGDTLELRLTNDTEKLISSAMHSFEVFIRQCLSLEPNINDQLQEIIASGKVSDFHEFIASHPVVAEETKLSLRSEHPQWFEGVGSRQHCKEGVLRGSAECRMRGYLQHVQKELRHLAESSEEPEDHGRISLASRVEQAIAHFKLCLKERRFNASYFDRSHPSACCRLCDADGQFLCGGEYSLHSCSARHAINPYANRQNRIIFSTWNLDHMIEKSRSVIPALKKILSSQPVDNVNLDYFFDLLFTKYDPRIYGDKRRCSPEPDQHDGKSKRCKLNDHFLSSSRLGGSNSLSKKDVCSATDVDCLSSSQPRVILENISTNLSIQNECNQEHDTLISSDEVEGNKLQVKALACKAKHELINSPQPSEMKHLENMGPKPLKYASPPKKQTQHPSSAQALPSCSYAASAHALSSDRLRCPACSRSKSILSRVHEPKDHAKPWPGNLKLVHIACHVKLPHDAQCDSQFFFRGSGCS